MRVANLPPRLARRMEELGIADVKSLAALTRPPVKYPALADCVKGDHRFQLHVALSVLAALKYKIDSDQLKLLYELSSLYIEPEDRTEKPKPKKISRAK